MARRTITSANSVFNLSAEGVYAGVRIEGFSADAAFAAESFETGVGQMGVDGKFSRGWVPSAIPQTITLNADSQSIDVFDAIYQYEKTQRETVHLTATITITATGKSYTLTDGVLTNYVPFASHGRTQAPVTFQILWGSVDIMRV